MTLSSKIIPSYTIIHKSSILLLIPIGNQNTQTRLHLLQHRHFPVFKCPFPTKLPHHRRFTIKSSTDSPLTYNSNNARGQHQTEQTDWNTFTKNCSRFKINQKLTTTADIRNRYQRSFRNSSFKTPNDQSSAANPVLQNLIKDKNRHRRKFQKNW